MRRVRTFVASAALAGVTAVAASGQESLTAARDLYTSAAYEDALDVLNRLKAANLRLEEQRAVEQYRAFCYLALGRGPEAERAIEAVVTAEPLYQPSTSEVSPRLRTAFSDVRRRVLPTLIQQRYSAAKAAFDRKEYELAAAGFDHVLQVMADRDLAPMAAQPPLSDLRTLATGFRDLSASAATPPPATVPAPAAVVSAPPPAVIPAVIPPRPRIYGSDDPNVVPPITITQWLPKYPTTLRSDVNGVLEVVINEQGTVERSTMRAPVGDRYDGLVIDATRAWRYRPATVDGQAVKYRKMIQIALRSEPRK